MPITNELLEEYHWQLVSAVSNTYDDNGQIASREPIGNFYHPDFPISFNFRSHPDSQYASFSSNCNGSGALYILMKDHTLKVGKNISTDMSCGPTSNRIESALYDLMSQSTSQLILSFRPTNLISKNETDYPHYNLLQTMETGETLVWQNEPISEPKPYPRLNLNDEIEAATPTITSD